VADALSSRRESAGLLDRQFDCSLAPEVPSAAFGRAVSMALAVPLLRGLAWSRRRSKGSSVRAGVTAEG
jgi:hypothetical protein